ncbi:MAG: DEAD/DEAH box helicase family protein, partial [Ignavibacteriales bacterium]|nr:DEAD/DEAH box helicase family protein [Ignavibacteriales bacterium]
MNRIKNILDCDSKPKIVPKGIIKKQQLTSAMAWQITNIYPNRKNSNSWNIYKNLRGVLIADEVGFGKTFEALTIITKSFLDVLKQNKRNFRVLIVANPAIRSKWEWNEDSDLACFFNQTNIHNVKDKKKLEQLLSSVKTEPRHIVKSKKDWKNLSKNLNTKCIVLTSVQALPTTTGRKTEAKFKSIFRFPQNKFDWIIADEAHIVKSGYAQTDEESIGTISNSAVRKLYAVLNSQTKAKLLLLSATPFHNNVKELKQLISLLDHRRNDGIVSIVGEGLDRFDSMFNEVRNNLGKENNFEEDLKLISEGTNNDLGKFFIEDDQPPSRPTELQKSGQKNGLDDYLRDV